MYVSVFPSSYTYESDTCLCIFTAQREEIYRADLQVVEAKLKKNLASFDALDKMAQHLPPGSSQLAGAQNELRVLSELLARLESQKQLLIKSIEELGGSAPSASGTILLPLNIPSSPFVVSSTKARLPMLKRCTILNPRLLVNWSCGQGTLLL